MPDRADYTVPRYWFYDRFIEYEELRKEIESD